MSIITYRNTGDVNPLRNVSGTAMMPTCNFRGMDWKDTIKHKLKLDGISQDVLAERMGVSQGAVNHWLSGRRNADYVTVLRMADVLGMTMADIAIGSDTLTPAPSALPTSPDPRLTIADLLAGLKDEIDAQPETMKKMVVGMVAEYLTNPDHENGQRIAEAIENIVKK